MAQRTLKQNKAIHVLFELMAEELNTAGLDMKRTLKPEVDIPWTGVTVKEYLWRPVQQAQFNKKSTTELSTSEVDKVFETINRHIGEKFGLYIPFPSIERIIDESKNQ